MQNNKSNSSSSWKSLFTIGVIIVAYGVSLLIFYYVMGDKSHFMDNDPTKNPKGGDFLGTIYKGGFIVPVLMTLLLMVITFSIERFLTILSSQGSGNGDTFLRNVKSLLSSGNIDGAIMECDKQKGSIGNVVRNGLVKYKQVNNDATMSKDEKLSAISKELEESTSLELPMLEKNLVILATIASIATLMGLLGTVFVPSLPLPMQVRRMQWLFPQVSPKHLSIPLSVSVLRPWRLCYIIPLPLLLMVSLTA